MPADEPLFLRESAKHEAFARSLRETADRLMLAQTKADLFYVRDWLNGVLADDEMPPDTQHELDQTQEQAIDRAVALQVAWLNSKLGPLTDVDARYRRQAKVREAITMLVAKATEHNLSRVSSGGIVVTRTIRDISPEGTPVGVWVAICAELTTYAVPDAEPAEVGQ